MMRWVAGLIIFMIAMAFYAWMYSVDPTVPVTAPVQEVTVPDSASDAGGIGLGYNGKLGIDLGGGLILTPDGVSIGMGF